MRKEPACLRLTEGDIRATCNVVRGNSVEVKIQTNAIGR